MTLSESQALDSFDFLAAEDAVLLHRMSHISFSESGSEGSECNKCLCTYYAAHHLYMWVRLCM